MLLGHGPGYTDTDTMRYVGQQAVGLRSWWNQLGVPVGDYALYSTLLEGDDLTSTTHIPAPTLPTSRLPHHHFQTFDIDWCGPLWNIDPYGMIPLPTLDLHQVLLVSFSSLARFRWACCKNGTSRTSMSIALEREYFSGAFSLPAGMMPLSFRRVSGAFVASEAAS